MRTGMIISLVGLILLLTGIICLILLFAKEPGEKRRMERRMGEKY